MTKPFYLAVAGIISVGKTTAAKLLASKLNFSLLEENWGANQFLPRFYNNMPRWAFHSQTFYLLEKIKQTKGAKSFLKQGKPVIQDTPISQDVLSYAKAQFVLDNMDEAEFQLYTKIYSIFVKSLPQPDLIIFLEASWPVVFQRLKSRGRDFEQSLSKDYLKLLDKLNRQWIRKMDGSKVLRIKTDNLNLVNNQNDIAFLIQEVEDKAREILNG